MKKYNPYYLSKIIFFIGLSLVFFAHERSTRAEDQWFCREGASRLLGEVMESCGIGKSADEAEARKKALDGAFDEFDRICKESANCRDYEKTVEPMRTECIKGKDDQFTCYRALDFTVTHQKKEKSFEDKDKKDAIVSAISKNSDGTAAAPTDGDASKATNSDNNGMNPALANTTSTPSDPQTTTVYRNVHFYTVANPYVYVIGSQPQVVYVRSQLPPQYVPAPAPPASVAQPTHITPHRRHDANHAHKNPHGKGNREKKKFH